MKSIKILFLVFIISTLLVMVGCNNNQSTASEPAAQKQEETNEENASQEKIDNVRIITDHMGRQVEVPVNPQKIIALNPVMTETIVTLGVTPIAVPEEYKMFHPEYKDLPSTSIQQTPNIEVLHQLKPDLIFAHIRNHGQMVEQLEATGAAVVYFNPGKGNDPLLDVIRYFGHVTNRDVEADDYVQKIDTLSSELKKQVASCPIKSVVVLKYAENIMVAQPATFYGGLVARLGLENIVPSDLPGSSKESYLQYDMETIIQKNPEAMFIVVEGKGTQDNSEILAKYKNDPMWKEVTAVKENNMIIIPGKIGPGKISTEEALKKVAKLICSKQKGN